MDLDRLQKILRAGGRKPTAAVRSAENGKHRRYNDLIAANKNANECAHQAVRIEARRARRNHSSSSA